MEKEFEQLITSFISDKIGITNHFITDDLAQNIKQQILNLIADNLLLPAGTGNNKEVLHNTEVRGDSIYWLDRKHNNEFEHEFLNQIDDFVKHLNRSCFAGITSYEFHYSLYEAGSFYSKHYDQFKNNNGRQYSMISYLNSRPSKSQFQTLIIRQYFGKPNS